MSPPLDPESIASIAKTVSDIYGDAVNQMLAVVAKRMARGIDDPGWAEAKLLELVGLRADAQKVIDELQRSGPPAVRKAIEEASKAGQVNAARQLRMSLKPSTNTAAVEALAHETVTRMQAAHVGILRSVDDSYRRIIAEASAPGVVTGTTTTRQAVQRALNRFADAGVTGFRDRAGRNWELTAYAEMATRTASGRAMIDGRLGVYQADGRDLVIVSDAPQECGLCRPWEGKVLSISGSTPKGERLDDGVKVAGTVSEARAAGLMHPSCRHDLRPYIVGLTRPFTGTEDPEGDKARREQRRLERQVRKWKNREAVALDKHASTSARARWKQAERRLADHIRDNDLKRLRYREGKRLTGSTPTPTTHGIRSQIDRDSAHGRQVTRALDAIQRTHDLPESMRGTTIIDGTGMGSGRLGFYRPRTRTLALAPGEAAPVALTHEIGHALSYRVFGGRGSVLKAHPALKAAIESTPEVKQLRAALVTASDPHQIDRLHYLLSSEELWARAYSQWVAVRSGDAAMMRSLDSIRVIQWDDSTFDPIAREVAGVLRAKGLLP